MDKATQKAKILQYCAEHGSITIRQAFEELKINSPTKRISELRQSGFYEVTDIEEQRNDTRYKRYFIRAVSE